MSDQKYWDINGNECSLLHLIRIEPEWAENALKQLKVRAEKAESELAEIKSVDRFTEKTAHLVPSLEGAIHDRLTPQKGERIRMVDEKWKKRAILWKRCAKKFYDAWKVTSNHLTEKEWDALIEAHSKAEEEVEKVEAELSSLKKQLVEQLEKWVRASDGEQVLRQATRAAQAYTENLQEKRRLDSAKLNELFTILTREG